MIILGTNSIKDTGYDVANSCMFNDDDSAELTKTFGSAGNQKTWTFSFWIKRSGISGSTTYSILEAGHGSTPWFVFTFNNDILQVAATAGTAAGWSTSAVFRDPSAWYHVVLAVDTTSSTSSISNGSTDRFRIFVNNVQQTLSGGSVPSQDADLQWNGTAGQHMFGASYGQFMDGYVSEVAFIDGSALNPSSFGEYDSDSPTIWKPKDFKDDVTFGTNGYYLDFADSGDLGDDESGNGNDWTEANLAATDQSSDSPTNNFCTINPLNTFPSTPPALAEGNLQCSTINADPGYFGGSGTIGVSQAKWYFEVTPTASTSGAPFLIGVSYDPAEAARLGTNAAAQYTASEYAYYGHNGNKFNNDSDSSYGNSYAVDDIVGVALDLDNHKIYFSKNGTWQNSGDPTTGSTGTGSAFNLTTGETYFPFLSDGGGAVVTYQLNFGSPPYAVSSGNADANGYGNFEYAPPSGYLALCTKNLGSDGG